MTTPTNNNNVFSFAQGEVEIYQTLNSSSDKNQKILQLLEMILLMNKATSNDEQPSSRLSK